MSDAKKNTLVVKVINPWLYNGVMLKEGEDIELNFNKAIRHMKVGDVERDEDGIKRYKATQKSNAEAQLRDSQADW